ncbi:MAG: DUF1097 family protein, partial [Hyphomicrobium sp.]
MLHLQAQVQALPNSHAERRHLAARIHGEAPTSRQSEGVDMTGLSMPNPAERLNSSAPSLDATRLERPSCCGLTGQQLEQRKYIMLQRIRGALPLSLAIALLAFAWVEVSLNFTFHWVTSGDLGVGLELPSNLQLITPAAFIAWAVFFAAGADSAAFAKTVVSSIVGATAALLLMLISPKLAEL